MTKSLDEIFAVAEDPAYRRVATARIPLVRADLLEEHARLEALLPTLISDTIDAHPDSHATAERIAEIERELDAATIEFKFENIGHRSWTVLMAKHPPTPAQLKLNKQLDHNPETFPYEAIAASCVEPKVTVADVRRLDESPLMDVRNWNELWGACIRANVSDVVPKSLRAGLIRRQSGAFATTAANGEFRAASSSAEL